MPIYSGSLAEGVCAWGVSPLGVTLVASHLQELTLGPEKLPITCITNETAATHAEREVEPPTEKQEETEEEA